MKRHFTITDKNGNAVYDSELVQNAINEVGKKIIYKKLWEKDLQ